MGRDTYVPFALWVSAAIVAHIAWGGGAYTVAKALEEMSDVRWFANDVRMDLAQARSVEVTLEDGPAKVDDTPEDKEPPPDPAKVEPPKPKADVPKPEDKPPEPTKPEEAKKPEPAKPIAIFPVPAAPAPPPPPPPPEMQPPKSDQRIAVRQHVKDPNQADNPTARFIGDQANHVEEESVARITSHDQDDPNPTPGTNKSGAGNEPGNSTRDRIGQSEDSPGDPNKPPGESSDQHSAVLKARPAPATAKVMPASKPPEPVARATQPAPRPAAPAPAATPNEPTAQGPEALAAENGGFTIDPRRKHHNKPAAPAPLLPPGLAPTPMRLGARANDHGVRTSLAQPDVVAAVGPDEITRMREASGERRRSEHRGNWQGSTFERWRGAIENYVSSVRPGNQTALNTAAVPFATYLNSIHNRIHPVFADTFLAALDSLPFDHPMNDYKIYTSLEIVVEPKEGRVVKMGVVKTSGITAFDVGALDSVYRSQPFGQAPDAIISRDGNVYLHWEFHRNPIYACSTMNARPYILNNPPAIEPSTPPHEPKPPADPRERGTPPAAPPNEGSGRYGSIWRREGHAG